MSGRKETFLAGIASMDLEAGFEYGAGCELIPQGLKYFFEPWRLGNASDMLNG